MHPLHRSWLPFLRLLLAFVALCLLLAQLEVALRILSNQTVGMPNPILPYDPLPPPSDLPFMGISIDPFQLPPNAQTTTAQKAIFQELANSGMGWVRLRVAWDQIEPWPG